MTPPLKTLTYVRMYVLTYVCMLCMLLLLLLWRSTRGGGKKCQPRSPRAERKGGVGWRYTGWAGTNDDGVGGCRPLFGGRVAEGGPTCLCDPCPLPRRGGRASALVSDGPGRGRGAERAEGTPRWGRHARVRGHSAPCLNIPPKWPFLVCHRVAEVGAGLCA